MYKRQAHKLLYCVTSLKSSGRGRSRRGGPVRGCGVAEVRRFHAFVSYAHEDVPWVTTLADNLHRLGLDLWLDQWEMVPGHQVATRLQDGLTEAGAVVAVVSRRWVESGWCGLEFAAAVTAAVEQGKPLIPVVVGEVDLPPFIAARLYVDFRHVASPAQYESLVRQLERALRGRPSTRRPERGGPLVIPDAVAYRPDGPTQAELRIGTSMVTFSTASGEASCRPRGVDHLLEQRLWLLQRSRDRASFGLATRQLPPAEDVTASGGPAGMLTAVGEALSERFVCGEVAAALAEQEELARARHASLRIGLAVDDPQWVDLPWETLSVAGTGPLVLSEQVELYRAVARESAPVAVQVPGPLRILAVVASPEAGGGELLDYERELGRILDAVDPARAGHGAYVRVLNWGSLAEIRAALERERFHVLHLSCHAGPGVLLLEDERGQADEVDAERFLTEGLPTGRVVPLVVLAGCSTARTPAPSVAAEEGSDSGAEGPAVEDAREQGRARAGLARELPARGVPAVLAMTESVTDHYATELAAEIYRTLARAEHPDPLTALSQARRTLEARRRELPESDPFAACTEWATPALFLAGPPLPLFDRTHSVGQVPLEPEAVLEEGMVVRKVGEFVGRRTELRHLLAALRDPQTAGVLVHGIGGVGKSTLAAELLHHYGTHNRLIVPVSATTTRTVDAVLQALRLRLSTYCSTEGLPENDPLRRAAVELTDARAPWQERWELIRQIVLPRLQAVLIVDNAEDLLTPTPSGDGRQPLPLHPAPARPPAPHHPSSGTALTGGDPQAHVAAARPRRPQPRRPAPCLRRCRRPPARPGVPRRPTAWWTGTLPRHRRPHGSRTGKPRHIRSRTLAGGRGRRPGHRAGRDRHSRCRRHPPRHPARPDRTSAGGTAAAGRAGRLPHPGRPDRGRLATVRSHRVPRARPRGPAARPLAEHTHRAGARDRSGTGGRLRPAT
ncbi:TIR domain-containing protein [Streptomyces resistomycificus]|uniref:TIR domain-containing protein n=1 Tax=Streptomyces resistomycificus TaxID=67356 RepID=UPI0009984918|nr:TIR domain-containing protein [Streptomyces resistomycificus]